MAQEEQTEPQSLRDGSTASIETRVHQVSGMMLKRKAGHDD
jgi:hypothetical protein